jgi:hypothetical protein
LNWFQRFFLLQQLIEGFCLERIDRDASLPENEVVCGNVIEHRAFVILDELSESADTLVITNLDREDIICRISKLQTIQLKESFARDQTRLCNYLGVRKV